MKSISNVAIAIDERNYEDVIAFIEKMDDKPKEIVKETVDDTYVIFYWEYVLWDDENKAIARLLMYLEIIRHAYVVIDKETDEVFKEYSCNDSQGCDEEFQEILGVDSEVLIWNDHISEEDNVNYSEYADCERRHEILTSGVFLEEYTSHIKNLDMLIEEYSDFGQKERAVIDRTLTHLCGCSLPDLLEKACEREYGYRKEELVLIANEMLSYLSNFDSFDTEEYIREDEDTSDMDYLRLDALVNSLWAYLYDLWSINHSDKEIKEKLVDMGIHEDDEEFNCYDL